MTKVLWHFVLLESTERCCGRSVDEDAYCGDHDAVGNNMKRKSAYRSHIYERCGFMDKKRRVVWPICIMEGIRNMWLDKYASYMGFYKE